MDYLSYLTDISFLVFVFMLLLTVIFALVWVMKRLPDSSNALLVLIVPFCLVFAHLWIAGVLIYKNVIDAKPSDVAALDWGVHVASMEGNPISDEYLSVVATLSSDGNYSSLDVHYLLLYRIFLLKKHRIEMIEWCTMFDDSIVNTLCLSDVESAVLVEGI